jgi:hypothetical protein
MALARRRVQAGHWHQVTLVQAPVEEARWSRQADAALLHFTHDILRRPAALDHVLTHLRPGARVVATGLQWAEPWVWPVNLFVLGAALYSVSSLDGLAQPWSELAQRLEAFEVHATWMGGIFMASGYRPGCERGSGRRQRELKQKRGAQAHPQLGRGMHRRERLGRHRQRSHAQRPLRQCLHRRTKHGLEGTAQVLR